MFDEIERMCRSALEGNRSVAEVESMIRNYLVVQERFDTFLGGFILTNIGEVLESYKQDPEGEFYEECDCGVGYSGSPHMRGCSALSD